VGSHDWVAPPRAAGSSGRSGLKAFPSIDAAGCDDAANHAPPALRCLRCSGSSASQ
jgi:hypothetical protein